MVGHGRPQKAPIPTARGGERDFVGIIRWWRIGLFLCALCIEAVCGGAPLTNADELDLRLRVTWGEVTPRLWNGTMRLSEGRFTEVAHLGYENNAPTSVVNTGSALRLWQPAPGVLDGLDLRIAAPSGATLTIWLQADSDAKSETTLIVPLAEFASDAKHHMSTRLDDRDNRLTIRRTPGDALRIHFERESLVFAPRESWSFAVQPHRLAPLADLRCTLQLLDSRSGKEHWSEQYDVTTDSSGMAAASRNLTITLPTEEGVYELVASLRERKFNAPVLVQSLRERKFSTPIVAQRKVQLLVLDAQPAPIEQTDWLEVDDVQPGSDKWWERWTRLPTWKLNDDPQGPVDNGLVSLREHLGQQLTQLAVSGWQAAPLPISRIGAPHLLEVEYPNDAAQTLAISILEPNAAGIVTPLGLDSGVDVVRSPVAIPPGMEKHRLIFWPQTKTPWLLLSNRREDAPASFGKIRVLAGPTRLPPSPVANMRLDGRSLAAYYDKPLFPENFSAPEALDELPRQSLDDWNTFHLGGRRLVEYLKHVGYDRAIVSVARDGATIYPSRVLDSTPRYDSGVFFTSGQDPQRKDVLEMLFRLFDRENLTLVPALHLATPLPELERLLKVGGPNAGGIELVGSDGRTWAARFGTNRGQAPYYNPLDPHVQTAIRHVVNEVVDRYGHHPSFAGVSLQLGPSTYVQLPGTAWGNDDLTTARFQAETKSEVPGTGATRFQTRAKYLTGPGRSGWLAWRAEKLAAFYQELQNDVARRRPEAKLYLATAELLNSSLVKDALHPRLPYRPGLADALLQIGLDTPQLSSSIELVSLRPQRLKPLTTLADQALELQLRDSSSVDKLFQSGNLHGALNYHEPITFALPSFDSASPFGPEKTQTWFAAHLPRNGIHARAPFIHSLASLDAQVIADGGWMLPLGQEDALRKQYETFRQLPGARFETVEPNSLTAQAATVVIRKLTLGTRTYFYVINDAPWPVTADIDLELPPQAMLHRFGTLQPEQPVTVAGTSVWTLSLEPYDLVGGFLSVPDAKILDWRVRFDRNIKVELTSLVQEVKSKVNDLRTRSPLNVVQNPGFEQVDAQGQPVGWDYSRARGVVIEADKSDPHRGQQSLHMKVTEPQAVAWVRNKPFAAPKTGRLSLLAWVRTKDPKQQPQLRLSMDTGRGYYTFATLGKDVNNVQVKEQLGATWPAEPFLFHCDNLPANLEQITIGFDLIGEGEVWVDDVEVYDLYFFETELNELIKNVATAHFQLDEGRVADCERFLNGYWPRFVIEHVPALRVAELPRTAPDSRTLPAPAVNRPPPAVEEKPTGWQRYVPIPKMKLPFSNRAP